MRNKPLALLLLSYVGAGMLAACTEITSLKQSNPGAIEATKVYVPSNALLLVNGAIADFECAFTRYVVGSGVLSDELGNAIGQQANYDLDARRLLTNGTYGTTSCGVGANQVPPIYVPLSTARGAADVVIARLMEWTDAEMPANVNRTRLIAQAYAYAGYSLTLMGEGMCNAAINVGPMLTPAQLYDTAKARFDSAIAYANKVTPNTAADVTLRNFATLGRARVELNQGNGAAAAADAAAIPSGFVVNTSTDAVNARRQNFAFVFINNNSFGTVDPTFRGLTLGAGNDPRVAVTNSGRNGTAANAPQVWTVDKYNALTAVMPIAKYAEAQLILADTRAAANDLPGAEAAINAARNTRPGMPQYSATGLTQAEVQAQIIEERRRELFLEGHRLGDIRRYNIALAPAASSAYPGGGLYGPQNCFPLPDVERLNNPNIPKP
ncbi:MAG TPA: RagB/SusD family nutrient uptake outer membrane protein [Gemmatimonadaceae bacterium]|nr:RagB/SusD family nutrient uptake outer membrane protein [Gemmatimonadaceae bacterium]